MLITPKCDYQPATVGYERREERVVKIVGNEESRRDEVIHFASAMQFAGFRQVL
jgi:hypothetical protein